MKRGEEREERRERRFNYFDILNQQIVPLCCCCVVLFVSAGLFLGASGNGLVNGLYLVFLLFVYFLPLVEQGPLWTPRLLVS